MKNGITTATRLILAALGKALRVEYEAIVNSGFLLQLDCPDLALERHLSYQDRPLGEFLGFVERVARRSTRRSKRAARPGAPCMSAGAITRGRTIRRAARRHPADPAEGQGRRLRAALRNPRHQHEYRVLQKFPLADDQIIVAGVIDDLTGFVEHPEVVADRLETSRASSATQGGSWPAPIAASTPRPAWAASPRTSSGPR